VGGVVAGIIALATAVTGAGVALFALAEKTADYGSKVFDATQKTSLTAETITTMTAAAEAAGSNFDSTIPKLSKFTASLVDAAAGNKKLRAELAQFGIDGATAYTNPDKALRQFITKFN
jgi:hypothetical protein